MFSDNGGPSDRDRLHEAYKEIRRLQEALAAAQAPPASDPKDATHEYCPKCLMSGRLGAMTALRKDNGERYCLGCVERLQPLYPAAQAPPGLYRQGQEDMRRRVLDIVRDPSDCRIVKKLPIWGVPGMSEAAAAVAPLVERAQQATGGSDASDFRMRQSDPPGLVANWRPIETAPKRTDVLAGWADRPHWLPQVLQQDDAGMWFNGEESDYRPPTHWMPLPASPQAETKGDE